MRQALGFGKQGDKRLFQRLTRRVRFKLIGAAGRQNFPRVHGHQPVKALRLLHVSGGDQDAHLRLTLADAVDQIPKLRPREGIDAGGGFIEDQQLRVVNERAAQAELLLHPPGELSCRAVAKRRQAGTLEQLIDADVAFGFIMAEQTGEEIDVFIDRQGMVEVLPQPLGHPGDFRADVLAMTYIAHIAAEHHNVAVLNHARAGDQR